MQVPDWFSQVSWYQPVKLETLRSQRNLLPSSPGIYVFTNYDGPLTRNTGVLYVGKAERQNLRDRVPSYLADPSEVRTMSRTVPGRTSSSLRHPGKVGLLVEIQQKTRDGGPSGIWVRWATPEKSDVAKLEADLLAYLKPAFNTQGI